MGIAAVLLLIFGLYLYLRRLFGQKPTKSDEEFAGRLGRAIHYAHPIRGVAGQSSDDIAPQGPVVDEIGTEEHHRMVVDGSGRPIRHDEPSEPREVAPRRKRASKRS